MRSKVLNLLTIMFPIDDEFLVPIPLTKLSALVVRELTFAISGSFFMGFTAE